MEIEGTVFSARKRPGLLIEAQPLRVQMVSAYRLSGNVANDFSGDCIIPLLKNLQGQGRA